MSYLNSVSLIGFVGSDPEQRQARNNGAKFTVLSVATQRSWKNAEDEWVSKTEWHRIAVFRPRLAEHVLNTSSSKAASSALPTTSRTARAKSPRPRRSPPGRFAPMSCASSTAANRNPSRPRRERMLPAHPANPVRLPTKPTSNRAPARAGALFLCWPILRPHATNFAGRTVRVAASSLPRPAGFPSRRA